MTMVIWNCIRPHMNLFGRVYNKGDMTMLKRAKHLDNKDHLLSEWLVNNDSGYGWNHSRSAENLAHVIFSNGLGYVLARVEYNNTTSTYKVFTI